MGVVVLLRVGLGLVTVTSGGPLFVVAASDDWGHWTLMVAFTIRMREYYVPRAMSSNTKKLSRHTAAINRPDRAKEVNGGGVATAACATFHPLLYLSQSTKIVDFRHTVVQKVINMKEPDGSAPP